jgi:hypothetical protein
MKSNITTIETLITEFDHKNIRCGNLSLIAQRMNYDLSTCGLFDFAEAKYSEWNDNLRERFKNLKSYYLIDENSTILQLQNAIKIRFESYKLNNPNWYISTEYSKNLSNLFKNI